jgi:hypothetical protein
MLSPSQDFCKESNSTLKFGHACKKITNKVKKNKYKSKIPADLPFNTKSTMDKLKQKPMPWAGAVEMSE